jgi:protein involved in ribonucleotide reduction
MTIKNLLIVILFVLNLFLLFLYNNNVSTNVTNSTEIGAFDLEYISYKDINHYKLDKKNDSSFRIIVYIYESGCISCNKYVVKKIIDLYEKYREYISVIVVGGSKNYISKLGASFSYETTNEKQSFLNIENEEYYPIIMVLDKNGFIQKIHCVKYNSYEKSDIYFKMINSFFDSLIKKSSNY